MKFSYTNDYRKCKEYCTKLTRSGWVKGAIGWIGIGICAWLIEKGACERAASATGKNMCETMKDVNVDDNWDETHMVD